MDVAIMNPENKTRYLNLVNQEIEKKKKSLESIEHGRNTAESAMTSHHDHLRSDLAQDASVTQSIIENLQEFRNFIVSCERKTRIEEGAELIVVLLEEDETIGVIYAPIKVSIPGLQVMTPQSPIGQTIRGLVPGDMFVYKVAKHLMVGQIEKVE